MMGKEVPCTPNGPFFDRCNICRAQGHHPLGRREVGDGVFLSSSYNLSLGQYLPPPPRLSSPSLIFPYQHQYGRPAGDQRFRRSKERKNMAPPHLLQGGCCFFSSSSFRRRSTWPRPTSVPLLLLSSAFLLLLLLVSTVAFLFLILPTLFNFLVSNVPLLYRSLHSWLSPPYLYLVINGIIVSIAASSRFHHHHYPHPSHDHLLLHASDDKQQQPATPTTATTTPGPIITSSYDDGDDDLRRLSTTTPAYAADADLSTRTQVQVQQEAVEELVIDADLLLPLSIGIEKPLLSARFTAQRKSVIKAGGPSTPKEGNRVLLAGGVSKPKRNETSESTWKAITEGRATPLARVHHHHHLKKSETVSSMMVSSQDVRRSRNSSGEEEEEEEEEGLVTPVKKAETFKEQKRRKEASPGHEELNRRVEAFINKFNEEMRLQRQESFDHYLEMVNRGSN